MRINEFDESRQSCPECGGPSFTSLVLAEKQDACYAKVKSRYKVWPSAYASGALVQCRKKGAANWGNKSKNEDVAEGADERKQNALWAQITDYERRAKATKNDIKKAHYEKIANELRGKLKTSDNLEEGFSDMMAKERKKRLAAAEKKKQERRANTGDPAPQHYRDELAQAAKKYKKGVSEGEVVAFPKKHKGDLESVDSCVKCGGDLQGGTYMGHKVKVCMPCKQVYLPPNSGIDKQGNKIKESQLQLSENSYNPEYDDEAGMADNNLETLRRAVDGIDDLIQPGDNLPEWCQEKVANAKSMLVAVWDYMKSEQDRGATAELNEEFDLIESIINDIADHNGVDADVVWTDLESLTEDELYAFAVTSQLNEDWSKVNKRDKTDGMSRKAVKAYRRENPGSKLQTAVTTKPSKLKKGSKASKRRKSYCSRSRGQMKMHNISCAKTPDKAICKARRRWNC